MEINSFYLLITVYLGVIASIGEGNHYDLEPEVIEACNSLYHPSMLATSCCPQIDELTSIIRKCLYGENDDVLTSCSEVNCIASVYEVLSDDQELDKSKLIYLIERLNEVDEETRIMNALVLKNCVNGNFTSFPSEDEFCTTWKYLNCLVFSYNIACPNTRSNGKCASVKENIDKCRPCSEEFVAMLSQPSCSQ